MNSRGSGAVPCAMIPILQRLQDKARALKCEITALWFALRDARTPWLPRLIGALVVAYAVSPIDLIPDFIPVFGLLDDVILLPLGIALTIKLIPAAVMADARARAVDAARLPASRAAVAVILCVWLAAAWLLYRWLRVRWLT